MDTLKLKCFNKVVQLSFLLISIMPAVAQQTDQCPMGLYTKGSIDVPYQPGILNTEFFHQGGDGLLISSFLNHYSESSPGFRDHVAVIRDINNLDYSTYDPIVDYELLTEIDYAGGPPKTFFPNNAQKAPGGMFPFEALIVPEGSINNIWLAGRVIAVNMDDPLKTEYLIHQATFNISPFDPDNPADPNNSPRAYQQVAFADMDGDGDKDIISVSTGLKFAPFPFPAYGELVYFKNPGHTGMDPNTPWEQVVLVGGPDLPVPGPDAFFDVRDFDNDGIPEIVATHSYSALDDHEGEITLYGAPVGGTWADVDYGNGVEPRIKTISTDQGLPFSVEVVDLNMDGKLDVLASNRQMDNCFAETTTAQAGRIYALEQPASGDLFNDDWVTHILKDNILPQPNLSEPYDRVGRMAPGSVQTFTHLRFLKGLFKPMIVVSGDGAGKVWVLQAEHSYDPNNWNYQSAVVFDINDYYGERTTQTFVDGNSISTIGKVAVHYNQPGPFGVAELYIPVFEGKKIHVLSYDRFNSDAQPISCPADTTYNCPAICSVDTDNDGICDENDPDRDGDGVDNAQDLFPLNAMEWADSDGDCGISGVDFDPLDVTAGDSCGDNSDSTPNGESCAVVAGVDSDGDCYPDNEDAFPNDVSEWADCDNDRIGDNTDGNMDGCKTYQLTNWVSYNNPSPNPNNANYTGSGTFTADLDGDGIIESLAGEDGSVIRGQAYLSNIGLSRLADGTGHGPVESEYLAYWRIDLVNKTITVEHDIVHCADPYTVAEAGDLVLDPTYPANAVFGKDVLIAEGCHCRNVLQSNSLNLCMKSPFFLGDDDTPIQTHTGDFFTNFPAYVSDEACVRSTTRPAAPESCRGTVVFKAVNQTDSYVPGKPFSVRYDGVDGVVTIHWFDFQLQCDSVDTDNDGVCDEHDPDRDGDGVENAQDLFPLDAAEWADCDNDRIGDNADTNTDACKTYRLVNWVAYNNAQPNPQFNQYMGSGTFSADLDGDGMVESLVGEDGSVIRGQVYLSNIGLSRGPDGTGHSAYESEYQQWWTIDLVNKTVTVDQDVVQCADPYTVVESSQLVLDPAYPANVTFGPDVLSAQGCNCRNILQSNTLNLCAKSPFFIGDDDTPTQLHMAGFMENFPTYVSDEACVRNDTRPGPPESCRGTLVFKAFNRTDPYVLGESFNIRYDNVDGVATVQLFDLQLQ